MNSAMAEAPTTTQSYEVSLPEESLQEHKMKEWALDPLLLFTADSNLTKVFKCQALCSLSSCG